MQANKPSKQVAESLRDPITYEIFSDPVTASDGHTYERKSIESWWDRCRQQAQPLTSPMTREIMNEQLYDNVIVCQLIAELQLTLQGAEEEEERKEDSTTPIAMFSLDEGQIESLASLSKVFEVVDPLRDMLHQLDWQPPQIVVMGNENSGKSTLLERIALMPLFPIEKRICTRMIVKICLRHEEPQPPLLEVRDLASNQVIRNQVVAMDTAAARIGEWMQEEVRRENNGSLSGLCRERMLVVHVRSLSVPNLDLVDLPGLVATHMHGEPDNMSTETRGLVEAYLTQHKQHSLFLVTVPANAAANQSIAMDIVQKHKLQNWTVGVLTKADLLDVSLDSDDEASDVESRFEDLRRMLRQESPDLIPLQPHGYVATMNKRLSSKKQSQFKCRFDTLAYQANREQKWFRTKVLDSRTPLERMTTNALVKCLGNMYHAYVMSSWLPDTVCLLRAEITRLQEADRRLGLPRAHDSSASNPSALAAHMRRILAALSDKQAIAVLCTQLYAEALNDGAPFQAQDTAVPVWEVNRWLEDVQKQQRGVVKKIGARCVGICRSHVLEALNASQDPFRSTRFPQVLEHVEAELQRLFCDATAELEAELAIMVQEYHSSTSSPNVAIVHLISKAGAVALCKLNYYSLNLSTCQKVMETVCLRMLSISWDEVLPLQGPVEIWRETHAAERIGIVERLHDIESASARLQTAMGLCEGAFDRVHGVLVKYAVPSTGAPDRVLRELTRTLAECTTSTALTQQLQALQNQPPKPTTIQSVHSRPNIMSLKDQLVSLQEIAKIDGDVAAVRELARFNAHYTGGSIQPNHLHTALELAVARDNAWDVVFALLTHLQSRIDQPADKSQANSCLQQLRQNQTLRLVSAALQRCSDEQLLIVACRCVQHMLLDQEIREQAREVGVIATMVQALRRSLHDPAVVESACAAIARLCDQDPNNGDDFTAAGACELVTQALETHLSVGSVVECTCKTVSSLLIGGKPENMRRLARAGACEAVVRALREHVQLPAAAEAACRALASLCQTNPCYNRFRCWLAGACEALTEALQLHTSIASVARPAVQAIQYLASNPRVSFAGTNAKSVVEACTTVDYHVTHPALLFLSREDHSSS